MLYDLNIAWYLSTSAEELERTLKFSSSLGYKCVALNHVLNPPISSKVSDPLPKFPTTGASSTVSNNSESSSNSKSDNGKYPEVLHRVTVNITDPNGYYQLPQLVQVFDILALRPQTEKAFLAACNTVAEVSIISLDLTQQFPFFFKPKPCMTAVKRGVRFEICYAQMLTADARGRANFIGNVMSLIRATKGRGFVISSEAKSAMRLRGAADVVNLLNVWGLGTERTMEGLGVNPRGVVVNEGVKRRGFRGVVDIIQVADRPEGEEKQDAAQRLKGKNKVDSDSDNKKRKAGDSNAQEEGTMSKRQAKRLKNLAMRKDKPT